MTGLKLASALTPTDGYGGGYHLRLTTYTVVFERLVQYNLEVAKPEFLETIKQNIFPFINHHERFNGVAWLI